MRQSRRIQQSKRTIFLIIGIIVATIIGTRAFSSPTTFPNEKDANELKATFNYIKSDPQLSMFYKALKKSGLREEMKDLESFTLLAPTNKAFQLLPEDVYENLLKKENKEQLIELISYHVLPSAFTKEELSEKKQLKTISNAKLNVTLDNGVKIENSYFSNLSFGKTENRVFGIDRVILPL